MLTPYIDLHCDTLSKARLGHKSDIGELPRAMVDLCRLQSGGCMAQFFAIFMPPITGKRYMGPFFPRDDGYVERLHSIFWNTLEQHGERIAFAGSAAQLEQNRELGKVSALLTLEDGRPVDGSIEKLEHLYTMGVRLITLTWNHPNCFGSPNSDDTKVMGQGLTTFGKEAVYHMQELGMVVDVSHLSDGGFADVAALCKGPFVASHSNCRALSPHRRNLTDPMLRTLAEHGGVAGLNFSSHFLNTDITHRDSSLSMMAAHLRHMLNVGGLDCPAIGTDFDGIKGRLEVPGADKMPLLFDYLEQVGFNDREIEHIAWKNALRVLREVL